MPVIHIRASIPETDPAIERLVGGLPAEVEAKAGLRPGGVWCTYSCLGAQSVAGRVVPTPVAGDGGGERGVAYVEVLLRPRGAAQMDAVLRAAAEAVADALGLPTADVWAHGTELRSGAVFAGGEVLTWPTEAAPGRSGGTPR